MRETATTSEPATAGFFQPTPVGQRAARLPDAVLRPIDLSVRSIYLAPSGRLCRLLPAHGETRNHWVFEYVDNDRGEGFSFTTDNIRLLRRRY